MRTEDGYLIYKCLNGDSDAFGLLVDKYKSGVYASVYSRLRNFHDAEDVTQEVFIRAYENLHKLRRWDSFASWLYRIASSLCGRWARTQSRRPDSQFIADNAPGVSESHSVSSYREEVVFESIHEALDSLPHIHREVLTLHYFGGMTSFEIARFVGMSPAAIRKRLSKARSLLKAEMLSMMESAFERRKLRAGFTLRISETVKHIKLRPLRVPWGLPVATGAMLVVLTLRMFTSSLDPVSDYMDPAMLRTIGSAYSGEIPVLILEQGDRMYKGGTKMLNDRKVKIMSVAAVTLAILSSNVLAETQWTKYEFNPVLDLGAPGTWEDYLVSSPAVLFDGTIYKMWYTGHDSFHTRIGYATSTDGVVWEKHPDNPILYGGASGTWNENVMMPSVVFNGTNYEMWYTGRVASGSVHYRIGYATAPLDQIAVAIDIKPGSYPNSINLGSQGVIPVAILSSESFDATQVDPMSVALAGAGVAIRGKGKTLAHEEDANGDGLTDLVVQVETENLDAGQFQDGYAVLTGQTYGGDSIEGSDEINIVPPEAAPAKPLVFETLEPYPKPANPEVWIPYKLAKGVEVTIIIYSTRGQLIRTLALGYQPVGAYINKDRAAYWDGRNEAGEHVASGIYFCAIQAEDSIVATKKMVVAK